MSGRVINAQPLQKTSSHIYLVMAFCASGDLSQHIRKAASSKTREAERYPPPKEGGLHEKVVRCFLGQLAEALKFLRDKDIIHRDIKPQNLLLHPASAEDIAAGHPEGIPLLQVADFGFARALPSTSLAETLCGSPLYMAPEILRYQKYDAKADLWSVGAVLYECCTGKPPFRAQNHVELLRRIERGQDRIKWPEDKREAEEPGREPIVTPRPIPNDIKELVNGLLRQNPVERMSFQEFFARADEVARWGEGSLVAPGTISQEHLRPAKTHSRQTSNAEVHSQPVSAVRTADPKSEGAAPPAPVQPSPEPDHLPIPSSAAEQEPAFTRPLPPSHTSSSRASGSATPAEGQQVPALVSRRSFAPKYIVGGGVDGASKKETVQVKTKDFAVVTTAPTPVTAMSPQSPQSTRESSRRNSTADGIPKREAEAPASQPKSGIALALPSNLANTRQMHLRNQQDMAVSGITGDDDSVLGREYVVVEKRNVEVNALADGEFNSSKRRVALSLMELRQNWRLRIVVPTPSVVEAPVVSCLGNLAHTRLHHLLLLVELDTSADRRLRLRLEVCHTHLQPHTAISGMQLYQSRLPLQEQPLNPTALRLDPAQIPRPPIIAMAPHPVDMVV